MGRETGPLEYEAREVGRRPVGRGTWLGIVMLVGLMVAGVGVMGTVFGRHPRGDVNVRVKCASNMKQIGAAILLYSNENRGRYPDRLEELLMTQDIGAEVFVCPETDDDDARGPTTRAMADALTTGGHLSYVYVGAGLTDKCDADTVVLYEPASNHGGRGMNVLFGDGHVEFVRAAEGREIVDRVGAGERPVVWKGPGVRVGPAAGKG